ncbi:MAG: hypothetical protein KAX57_03455 [Rhodoferax sp.]|jgi:hypothetical protein|uniref:hypothetical protein n=1 Tax=Rhodoferax sp. TaxID=50421 RepID=UPI001B400070|nr:hypothetical protein [Rhodoferax sp.]MBP8285876.1 hypothetical protein [Rhodoferax sp.]MBP9734305.1 hypothetical protein [Rhodoferax sp.]
MTDNRKRLETLRAKAALAGHQLIETQGGYMVRRWCYSKHVDSLDDVAALLEKMTGRPAK